MIITVNSPKLGLVEFLIDEDDFNKLKGYTFYAWTTKRHHGIYINCYSPDDRKNSKRLHRVIMGEPKGMIVDHINRNPLDNRKENLRITTSLVNNQNARKRKDGITSQYKGVHKVGNKWKAQIQVNKKKISLGTYTAEYYAARAYNDAIDHYKLATPKNIIKSTT